MEQLGEAGERDLPAEVSLEGRVKALEILVFLLLQDAAKDERRAEKLVSGLRHVARELRAKAEEDDQVAFLLETRSALLGRLATKYREEPFE